MFDLGIEIDEMSNPLLHDRKIVIDIVCDALIYYKIIYFSKKLI